MTELVVVLAGPARGHRGTATPSTVGPNCWNVTFDEPVRRSPNGWQWWSANNYAADDLEFLTDSGSPARIRWAVGTLIRDSHLLPDQGIRVEVEWHAKQIRDLLNGRST